jgi:hypothetical protein
MSARFDRWGLPPYPLLRASSIIVPPVTPLPLNPRHVLCCSSRVCCQVLSVDTACDPVHRRVNQNAQMRHCGNAARFAWTRNATNCVPRPNLNSGPRRSKRRALINWINHATWRSTRRSLSSMTAAQSTRWNSIHRERFAGGTCWWFRSMFFTVLCRKAVIGTAVNPDFIGHRAVSSEVERFVYTEDVGSSILSPPTTERF